MFKYFPAAYWWAFLLSSIYTWFDLYYKYLVYGNIWWNQLTDKEHESDLFLLWSWLNANEPDYILRSLNQYPELSSLYDSLASKTKVNTYWILDDICLDNKVLPMRERDFWITPNLIHKFR